MSNRRVLSVCLTISISTGNATVLIDDGSTYLVNSAQVVSENFDTDHQVTVGGGILSVTSGGSLIFNDSFTLLDSNGEGRVTVAGILEQNAATSSRIDAALTVTNGGILRALDSSWVIAGDSTFASGSTIEANGGDVLLLGGNHVLDRVSILGNSDLVLNDGNLSVQGDVGPAAGSATGGFSISGGVVQDFFSVAAGGGGKLSVDHGTLASGTIGTVASQGLQLRYTGNVSKTGNSTLNMVGGAIFSEGILSHGHLGVIDTDSVADLGAGTLINEGTWNMLGESIVSNSHGEGVFINRGILQTIGNQGAGRIWADFESVSGSEIRTAAASSITLVGSTSIASGTVLDNEGDLIFDVGQHELWGGDLSGAGFVQVGDPSSPGSAFGATAIVIIQAPVGPVAGLAGGGVHLKGGRLLGSQTGLGGPSFGMLSVDRGLLTSGVIDGATLRITGTGFQSSGGTVDLRRGKLINEDLFYQLTGSDLDLDPDPMADLSGTIENFGTWEMEGATEIGSNHGEGRFINAGTLQQLTAGEAAILGASLSNRDGAIIRTAENATLFLIGGGAYAPGSVFDSDGEIYLGNSSHLLSGGSLEGSGYLTVGAEASLDLLGDLNPRTDTAGGGFKLDGGTVANSGAIGGVGDFMISADRVILGDGAINGPDVRVVSRGRIADGALTRLVDSRLINEDLFFQNDGALLELDPNDDLGVFGTVVNEGDWQITGIAGVASEHGEGIFQNAGRVIVPADGNAGFIDGHFVNEETGTVTVAANSSLFLQGSSFHREGSLLDLDGPMSVMGNIHLFDGSAISGNAALNLSGGTLHVQSRVGPASGAATGGLNLFGGTLSGHWDAGGLGGGVPDATEGEINVDHGVLRNGLIDGGKLRISGTSNQPGQSTVSIRRGYFVNEGVHFQQNGGNYELDDSPAAGVGGRIINNGTWASEGTNSILNSRGEGVFQNSGLFSQDTGSMSMNSFLVNNGGTLEALNGIINLRGGGTFSAGSTLHANGEAIFLRDGVYQFNGGALTGNQYTYFPSGSSIIASDVGAASGPATGRIGINGGSLTGTGVLSAETGWLHSGTIGGTMGLRLTGDSRKPTNSQLRMTGGVIRNEGDFVQELNGTFDLDSTSAAGAGQIANSGSWTIEGNSQFYNSYGSGLVSNSGILTQNSGTTIFHSSFWNLDGGEVETSGGSLRFQGGGEHGAGSVFRTDEGSISLTGGTHRFLGGRFEGGNYVYASGGTLDLAGNIGPTTGPATGGFAVTGGFVTGNGMISVDRAFFASGTVTGGVTIRVTGDLSQQTTATLGMDGGVLQNESSGVQSMGGFLDLDSRSGGAAGSIVNNGTWRMFGGKTIYNSYGGGSFTNNNTFISSDGQNTMNAFMGLGGGSTTQIADGSFRAFGGLTMNPGAQINALGGSMYLSGGTNRLFGGLFTGDRFVYAAGGVTKVEGNVGAFGGPATGGFGLIGGLVGGNSQLSADRGYFTNGRIFESPTIRLTGASTKFGGSTLGMNGGMLVNEGAFTGEANGFIDLDDQSATGAGTIVNKGTWALDGNATYYNSYGGGHFINEGHFRHNSPEVSVINACFDHMNGSTFEATDRYVRLNGGGKLEAGATLFNNGGSTYFGGGIHTFEGGEITGSGFSFVNAGQVNLAGVVGAPSGTATGGFGLIGGLVGGTSQLSAERGYFTNGRIVNNPTIRLTGASTKFGGSTLGMNGGMLVNEGTFTGEANGFIDLDDQSATGAGTIVNKGTWALDGNAVYYNSYGGGHFINEGHFRHNSPEVSVINACFDHMSGSTFEATDRYVRLNGGGKLEAGATLFNNGGSTYFGGGTHTFEGGEITGSGFSFVNAGQVNLAGVVGAPSGTATGGFGLIGGLVGGTSQLSAERGYFTNGRIVNNPTIRLTGASTKFGGSTLGMNGGMLVNEGTFTGEANGFIDLDDQSATGAGTIVNKGTWALDGNAVYYNSYGGGQLINEGHFIHDDPGVSTMNQAFHHRAGSVLESKERYILLSGGGTMEPGSRLHNNGGSSYFQNGTHTLTGGEITGPNFTYANGGTVVVNGDVGANQGAALGGFGVSGGSVVGTHMISSDRGYLSSGKIGGEVQIRFTGESRKYGASTLGMTSGTLINEGHLCNEQNGFFDLDSSSVPGGGTILNRGLWELEGNTTHYNSYGKGRMINEGVFRSLGGTSSLNQEVVNTGMFEVASGTVYLRGGSTHSGGVIANGGVSFTSGTHRIDGLGGFLGGDSWIYGNLAMRNGARLTPGNSTGTIHLAGTLNFTSAESSPAIVIEINGTNDHDIIALENNGALSLGVGVTELKLELGYEPMTGDRFRIVDAGVSSGSFSGRFAGLLNDGNQVAGIFHGAIHQFEVRYDPSGKFIDLEVVSRTSPYDDWALAQGLTGNNADFTADPDGDGFANGLEFLFGGNPSRSSHDLGPGLTADDDFVTFHFRHAAQASYLIPRIVRSSDLVSWLQILHGVWGVPQSDSRTAMGRGLTGFGW